MPQKVILIITNLNGGFMAWWTLRNQHVDRAELIVEFAKDGKKLFLHQPYSWGAINIETEDDSQPDVDLQNLGGFNIENFECDNWEGGDYEDEGDVVFMSPDGLTDEEIEDLKNAYSDNWISGITELGWEDIGEQQWLLHGPLQLEDEDGNVVAKGDNDYE